MTLTLTPRQRQMLAMIAAGRTVRAVADALYVSTNTVSAHLYRARVANGLATTYQLIAVYAASCVDRIDALPVRMQRELNGTEQVA